MVWVPLVPEHSEATQRRGALVLGLWLGVVSGCEWVLGDIEVQPLRTEMPRNLSDGGAPDAAAPPPEPCSIGESRCLGARLQTCRGPERVWRTAQVCPSSAHCSTSLSICTAEACEQNVWQCSSGQLEVCLGPDTGWTAGPRCQSQALCEQALNACAATGCPAPECPDAACPPGEHRCRGEYLMVCGDDGRIELDVDLCVSAALCNASEGRCDEPVCERDALRCEQDDVVACAPDQSAWQLRELCTDGASCGELGGVAQCIRPSCTPGSHQCDGPRLLRCNATGDGLRVEDNCGAGEVCNAQLGLCQVGGDAGAGP